MKNRAKFLLVVFAVALGLSACFIGCSGDCEHTYTDKVIAPTCTEAGYTVHTCTKCGDSFSDTETDPLGHDRQTSVVAPKCEEKGYTLHKCSRCDDSYMDTYVDELGHEYDTENLSHNDDGHYHKCIRCDAHDTLIPHVYDETDYKFSANGHYTQCECGAKSTEQAHSYTQEVKNEDTIKNEANCEEPKTYFKSCVCGFISTADTFTEGEALGHDLERHAATAGTETTKASIEYWECKREDCGKFYSDATGTTQIYESDIYSDKIGRLLTVNDKITKYSDNRFIQSAENTMLYTKGAGAAADESAKLWFGQQDGNDSTVWEFDLTVVAGTGELFIIFRAWDDSNLYRLNFTVDGKVQFEKRKWSAGSGRSETVSRMNINGIEIEDNVDYHVVIMCLGWDKVVMVNNTVIYRIQEGDFSVGYFGIEGKGMDSISIENAYLRTYEGANIDEKREALEADYPDFWDDVMPGITHTCAHDYVDTVVPPTCKDDGYTEHKCKYCDHEYTDTPVQSTGAHVYGSYKNNGGNHTATCSACGSEIVQDHNYNKEVKNEQTLKTAENHEHGATYFRSCECGAVSQNDEETFTAAQVYKYLKDAVASQNITQAADGSLTYTKPGSAAEAVSFTFGSQSDNPRQYVEFDMEFVAGDWGMFELQFRRWDANTNMAVVRSTKNSGGKIKAIRTNWNDGRNTLEEWSIGGFTFEDNTKYHVVIMCCGWDKTVMVNNQVIFKYSADLYNVGQFHFESWDLQKLTVSHLIVRENYESDEAFRVEHPEIWNALGSGITNDKTIG